MKSELISQIIDSLENNSQEWSEHAYTMRHKSGLEIWISLGVLDCELHRPVNYSFSIVDRFRIWKAIKQCKYNKALSLLNESKVNNNSTQ
jgi:hypothetical protein